MNGNASADEPFFSVLLCSYNNFETIREAVDSVLNQEFKNFELILVNDGSTDRTPDVMQEYSIKYDFISYLTFAENIGKPLSINLAALKSNGKYLAIADADDIWHKDKLDIQFNELNIRPNLDVLGGQVMRFGEWGRSSKPTNLPLTNSEIRKMFKRRKMGVNNPTAVIRREAFLNIGGHRGYFRRNEDFDLFYRMHLNGNIFGNVSNVLTDYRTNSEFQKLGYWIRTEIGKQEIIFANGRKLYRWIPIIMRPTFLFDFVRLALSYILLWHRERS